MADDGQAKQVSSAWSRWFTALLVVLAVVGLGYALMLIFNSQILNRSLNQRNFHLLDVASRNLEDWPLEIASVADSVAHSAPDSAFPNGGSQLLRHPDLGKYEIEFENLATCEGQGPRNHDGESPLSGTRPPEELVSPGSAIGQREYFEPARQVGEGPRYVVVGRRDTFCFHAAVPLDRLVSPGFEDSPVSDFLIVAADGSIIEQIGPRTLPIDRLDSLMPTGGLSRSLTSLVTSSDGKATLVAGTPVMPASLRDTATLDVAGESYVAYAKPLGLGACPTAWRATDATRPADAGSHQCFAVVLMPTAELRRGWLSPSPVPLAGFVIAVLTFIVLLPLIRLLLIGSGESVSPGDLLGIVAGVPAAAVFVTLAVLFADKVMTDREVARQEIIANADDLARAAGGSIVAALTEASRGELSCAPNAQGLPVLESVYWVDDGGMPVSDRKPVGCTHEIRNFNNISKRDYFRAMNTGNVLRFEAQAAAATRPLAPEQVDKTRDISCAGRPASPLVYSLGQVRAQTDGIERTAILVQCPKQVAVGAPAYALLALQLGPLIAPILPAPQRFMVVDGTASRMPVLLHASRSHAGAENFLDESDLPSAKVAELQRLAADDSGSSTVNFSARYGGKPAMFAAVRIPHTHWLVLVWSEVDKVDQIAAHAISYALTGWIALAVLTLAAICLFLFLVRYRWRKYWPHEAADPIYARVRNLLCVVAAVATATLLLGPRGEIVGLILAALLVAALCVQTSPRDLFKRLKAQFPDGPLLNRNSRLELYCAWPLFAALLASMEATRVPAAIVVMVGAPLSIVLSKNPDDTEDPLSPLTERHFMQMTLALVFCMGVIPAMAVWNDAAVLADYVDKEQRLAVAEQQMGASQARASDLRDALDLKDVVGDGQGPHIASFVDTASKIASLNTFSAQLRYFGLSEDHRPLPWCKPVPSPVVSPAFCRGAKEGALGVFSASPAPINPLQPLAVTLLLALAVIFLWWLVNRGLCALAGFHVPLGAVRGLGVVLPPGGGATVPASGELPRNRTLMVAPQQVVRTRIAQYPWVKIVDLAEILLRAEDGQLDKPSFIEACFNSVRVRNDPDFGIEPPAAPPLLITSGLELVLRDALRRRAALLFCELADRALARGELRGIVMMTEMSPLERILDAFDTDEQGDPVANRVREELRWSRFFQNFSTITFSPINKLGSGREAKGVFERYGVDPAGPIGVVAKELRWLPGSVIDATIEKNLSADVASATARLPGTRHNRFPVSQQLMSHIYAFRIVEWARSLKIPSNEAAIDYMRSTLIEHYEQCWAASTYAERLALNAIAEGHFVNMRNTVALQSLVRRGLVVLDPSPRLMSRSFGLFIKQSERPDRLDEWRRNLPQSRWKISRWGLLLVAPAAVLILMMAAAETGEDLTALFSLLAAAAPALINLMVRSVRS
jgi:hypothetical protein